MLRSILGAAETQRPQEWGEGRRDPSGSTLQLPGAGGSLSGWLHINHAFLHARMSSVRRGAAVLCGFGELGASSPCQSPPSCCSAQGSCRDAEQIPGHPTDSEESWFPWILSLTVYPPNPFLQQLKSSPAENQPGPKVTFILPPFKRTRLQHHEELSDPEARTCSRAGIGAVRIRRSLPAQHGRDWMERALPMLEESWQRPQCHWARCPQRPSGHTPVL